MLSIESVKLTTQQKNSIEDKETTGYVCLECSNKVSAHVFAEFPKKSWTKEQLDEWKAYIKKENREAELYILKTRTGLASLIEELHRTEADFANSPATGRMMLTLRKKLRSDVKNIVNKLMMLI